MASSPPSVMSLLPIIGRASRAGGNASRIVNDNHAATGPNCKGKFGKSRVKGQESRARRKELGASWKAPGAGINRSAALLLSCSAALPIYCSASAAFRLSALRSLPSAVLPLSCSAALPFCCFPALCPPLSALCCSILHHSHLFTFFRC